MRGLTTRSLEKRELQEEKNSGGRRCGFFESRKNIGEDRSTTKSNGRERNNVGETRKTATNKPSNVFERASTRKKTTGGDQR